MHELKGGMHVDNLSLDPLGISCVQGYRQAQKKLSDYRTGGLMKDYFIRDSRSDTKEKRL